MSSGSYKLKQDGAYRRFMDKSHQAVNSDIFNVINIPEDSRNSPQVITKRELSFVTDFLRHIARSVQEASYIPVEVAREASHRLLNEASDDGHVSACYLSTLPDPLLARIFEWVIDAHCRALPVQGPLRNGLQRCVEAIGESRSEIHYPLSPRPSVETSDLGRTPPSLQLWSEPVAEFVAGLSANRQVTLRCACAGLFDSIRGRARLSSGSFIRDVGDPYLLNPAALDDKDHFIWVRRAGDEMPNGIPGPSRMRDIKGVRTSPWPEARFGYIGKEPDMYSTLDPILLIERLQEVAIAEVRPVIARLKADL